MKKIIFPILFLVLAAGIFACKKDSNEGNQPFIILLGLNPLNWALDEPYVDPGAEAYVVNQSGDTTNISSRLVMTDNVNVNQEGTYQVNYNVTDADGVAAVQKTRTVKVVLGK
ncbi:MAG TPA: immunoglobulin-like domain-containing protein [Bacteroidales bacterium]